MSTIDTLDIAYLAIGAKAALETLEHHERNRLTERHGGELGLIREVIDFAATVDGVYHEELEDEFGGVWAYDVAEPLGEAMVRHMAADTHGCISAETVRELVRNLAAQA